MANVIGLPLAFASSASGLSCCGVLTPLSSSALVSVIACPFRLRYMGMIIGFTGEPWSPMVAAYGMPSSKWVAWFSPSVRRSRMTAHDASFEIVDSMPCFLNRPSSWAITIDEQSVSAMMPMRTFGVSGASDAYAVPRQPSGTPASSAAAAVVFTKSRRVTHSPFLALLDGARQKNAPCLRTRQRRRERPSAPSSARTRRGRSAAGMPRERVRPLAGSEIAVTRSYALIARDTGTLALPNSFASRRSLLLRMAGRLFRYCTGHAHPIARDPRIDDAPERTHARQREERRDPAPARDPAQQLGHGVGAGEHAAVGKDELHGGHALRVGDVGKARPAGRRAARQDLEGAAVHRPPHDPQRAGAAHRALTVVDERRDRRGARGYRPHRLASER